VDPDPKREVFSKTHNNLQSKHFSDDEQSNEEEVLMPAPKTKKHQPG
jgi:hypothetical protein